MEEFLTPENSWTDAGPGQHLMSGFSWTSQGDILTLAGGMTSVNSEKLCWHWPVNRTQSCPGWRNRRGGIQRLKAEKERIPKWGGPLLWCEMVNKLCNIDLRPQNLSLRPYRTAPPSLAAASLQEFFSSQPLIYGFFLFLSFLWLQYRQKSPKLQSLQKSSMDCHFCEPFWLWFAH